MCLPGGTGNGLFSRLSPGKENVGKVRSFPCPPLDNGAFPFYDIKKKGGFPVINKTVAPKQYALNHRHPYAELILNISGTGTNTVGDLEIPFYPGSVLYVPAGVEHCKKADERFEDIFIRLDDVRYDEVKMGEDDEFHSIQKIMEVLHYHYFRHDKTSNSTVAALYTSLKEMIKELFRHPDENRYAEALHCDIIRNFTDPEFSLQKAMENMPYSVDYLRRVFIKTFGTTPKDYLTGLRMEKAAAMLRVGDVNIADISIQCGYYDASYFARMFKQRFGIVPSEYRSKSLLSVQ